jgi:N-acetylated-alpha-linked acidic dipeptidase
MDPTFEYGVTLAKTGSRLALRFAQADVLPFELSRFSATVSRYAEDVQKLADTMRKETEERNRKIADKVYQLVDDPTETWVAPKPLDPVPYLSFAPLQNAVGKLKDSTAAFHKALAAKGGQPIPPATRNAVNAILLKLERSLTRAEGLPGRPWYVHQIYAPGQYTGYGVKTLPAVREAIELRQWREANEQIVVVGKIIEGFAAEVDKATALLE